MGESSSIRRLQQVRQIFEDAVDLDQEAWPDFLEKACKGNAELRAEVEALLSRNTESDGELKRLEKDVLGPPVAELRSNPGLVHELAKPPEDDGELREGATVGPFRLIRLIGEGGFGSIWMAQQTAPVRRKVAIKFLKPEMGSHQILERFESERQTLAMMQHPNVAQIFDAGRSPGGRSYFVMELVEGEPLVRFCQRNRLTLESRLKLFMVVCSAVQHAHQKGIIHRDLKPTNILVHSEEGPGGQVAVPKIIDFGVAKALTQQLSEEPLETSYGQIIGTPVYMSPEQAELGGADVDTRSDIYSLGVILYELITGSLPYEEHISSRSSFGDFQRVIREVDPPKPSSRLRRLQTENYPRLSKTLEGMNSEYVLLRRVLHSDLDWVVLRCLEKDRSRRYQTAHGLALDIGRFLNSEPLNAGPPTTRYRISKYARRHRRGVLAVAFMFIFLVLGFAGTSFGFIRAKKAQQSEIKERERAEARARELQAVTDFQQSVFERLVPEEIGSTIFNSILSRYEVLLEREGISEEDRNGRMGEVRDQLYQLNPTDIARQTFNDIVLARASEAVSEDFASQPAVEAPLREALAGAFIQMGLPTEARNEQEKALGLWISVRGQAHPDTLKSELALARILMEGKYYDEARDLLLAIQSRAKGVSGIPPDFAPELLYDLGQVEYKLGHWESAEGQLTAAHELYKSLYGKDHPLALRAELEKVHAMRHFDYNIGYNSLLIQQDMSMVALEQEPLFERLVERAVSLFGDDNPLVWSARRYHVETLAMKTWLPVEENRNNAWSIELAERAERILKKVVVSQSRVLGEFHPLTLETRKIIPFLGKGLKGDAAREAEATLEDILDSEIKIWGENHPSVVESLARIARMQDDFGLGEKSLANTRRAIRIQKRLHPEPNVELADLYLTYAERLLYFRYPKEAFEAITACMEIADQLELPEGKWNRYKRRQLMCLSAVGRLKEVERYYRETGRKGLLAEVLVLQGRWEEAFQLVKELREGFIERFGSPHAYQLRTFYWKVSGWLMNRDMKEEAYQWGQDLLACQRMTLEEEKPGVGTELMQALMLIELGEMDEARRHAENWEARRDEFVAGFDSDVRRSVDYPYCEGNPYLCKEVFLLRSVELWDKLGETGKADQYFEKYLVFRKWLRNESDPELLEHYNRIASGEHGVFPVWGPAESVARRGHWELAEWLYTRSMDQPIKRWWHDPAMMRKAYASIIDFYRQWNKVDPDGGHLGEIPRWEAEVQKIDEETENWRKLAARDHGLGQTGLIE